VSQLRLFEDHDGWHRDDHVIHYPLDSWRLRSKEPGPYGVGPIIEIPRERIFGLRELDRTLSFSDPYRRGTIEGVDSVVDIP